MPVTLNCSIASTPFWFVRSKLGFPWRGHLFHQFLQGEHQLINDILFAIPNVCHYTGADVIGQKVPVKGVHGGGDCR